MIQIDFPLPPNCLACPLSRFSVAAGTMWCPLIQGSTEPNKRNSACPIIYIETPTDTSNGGTPT